MWPFNTTDWRLVDKERKKEERERIACPDQKIKRESWWLRELERQERDSVEENRTKRQASSTVYPSPKRRSKR